MKRWEYKRLTMGDKVIHYDLEEIFNRLGENGWELVSVFSMNGDRDVYAVFRREKKLVSYSRD